MIVYTNKDVVYIRAGHSSEHKQGKLPKGVALNTIDETDEDYELNKEHTKAVIEIYDPERDSDYTQYPNFWVEKVDVSEEDTAPIPPPVEPPVDPPPVGNVDDLEAGQAFTKLMRWIVDIWK
jgi:hypothetical protein